MIFPLLGILVGLSVLAVGLGQRFLIKKVETGRTSILVGSVIVIISLVGMGLFFGMIFLSVAGMNP